MHVYKINWLASSSVIDLPFCRVYPEEYLLSWNGACIPNFFVNTYEPPKTIYIKKWHQAGIFLDDHETKILNGKYYLLGSATNYFHFLYDVLPRLQPYIENGLNVPILTDRYILEDNNCFQRQYLEIMGIKAENLFPVSRGHTYLAENLLCYSTRTDKNFGGPVQQTSYSLSWLRGHIHRSMFVEPASSGRAGRKLFVSRADCPLSLQRLASHDEIAAMFAERGFEIVTLRGMSAQEQVRMFSEADIVAGPHGAGLANTLFCREGATIIELSNLLEEKVYEKADCYWRYSSKHLGQCYKFINIPTEDFRHTIKDLFSQMDRL